MTDKHGSLADYNLEKLAELLEDPETLNSVAVQIPKGAHVFHGVEAEPEMSASFRRVFIERGSPGVYQTICGA